MSIVEREQWKSSKEQRAAACYRGRAGRDPICQDPWHSPPALAQRIVGAAATKVAAIALANKIASVAWAMMARGERYKEAVALAGLNELASTTLQRSRPC